MSLSNSRFVALLACLSLSACGGTSGGSSSNVVGSTAGTFSLVTNSSSSKTTTSSGGTSSAASSNNFDTTITFTPVPSVPGNVTAVSPDTTIDNGTVVTFGQVFPAGEIASGQVVQARNGGTNLPTQTIVKRRHPDNSIRHAIISVRLPAASVSSGQATVAMTLSATGSGASGTPLTVSDVTGASNPDYRVEIIEKSTTASGASTPETGLLWGANLKASLSNNADSWISGPLVSEWRSRVAPTATGISGGHPGLRIIFDARYQSTSQGRVSITMENVESNSSRGDRLYNLRIYQIIGGTTDLVYSADDVKHYAHTRFRKVFNFGTGSKDMLTIADTARLKNARAIPNYANITIPEATLASRYNEWVSSNRGLYQPGKIVPGMGGTGGREDIGPLPGWTARAMISGDPRMYQVMLDHADRAGFWKVHWRDTLKPGATVANAQIFSIDDHPNFSLFNPSYAADSYVGSSHMNWKGDYIPPTNLALTEPPGWGQDDAHEPSLSYVPYMVTGDRYYLDELYFYAAWHHIHYHWGYRGEDKGWYASSVTREAAWKLRTGGHAAWISPDSDWQKTYFTTKLNNNFDWFRTTVVPTNTIGYWIGWSGFASYELPYSPGGVAEVVSPWQHDFMAYTLFELCEKGYAATDLRDFALSFSVKRFTSGADFDRLDGATYRLPAKLTSGATLTSMSQLNYYAFGGVSYATRNPTIPTKVAGYNDSNGYIGIAMTALSGAIDSAGADTTIPSSGYVFLRDQAMYAGNGNADRSGYVSNPTWNIVPRNTVVGLSEAPGVYTK
ncbi:hypothetical protein [Viridibacterium curvum]|uniref:Uncharacterized protein n=1 Tax=Viridibacterium curvum TaxID=1101404 RepID=A0ABP9QF00_9RHOO